MTFLAPGFLWALAAIAPLVAIYLLKVRPRRQPTTAMFLWQKVFTEKRSTALLHRLRDVLSLLLMAAALIALVLAMARPQISDADRRDLLLLIDRSASMATRDGGQSRLDRAKEIAREIVTGLSGQQRVAVASVADDVVYHSYLTDDPRKLRDAIAGITTATVPLQMAAMQSVRDLAGIGEQTRVLLLSDAAAADFAAPEPIELLKVGRPAGNVGIVGADLRAAPTPGQLWLYVQLASSYDEPRDLDLVLQRDDLVVKLVPVTVEPGVNPPQVLDVAAGPGAYELRLDGSDALASDDVAYLSVAPPRPVRVAVRAAAPYFFEHSVAAFARSGGLLTLDRVSPDLVISDGSAASDASLSVVFAPAGEEPLDSVTPRRRVADHPALRYLPVEDLRFAGAARAAAPTGALVLVEDADGTPLIWQTRDGDATTVAINMDPAEGEFFFSPYFPVLVHGIATYLGGRSEAIAAVYPTRDRVALPGAQPGAALTLTPPNAEPVTLTTDARPRLDTPGFYTLATARDTWTLGSALLSRDDTLVTRDAASTAGPVARGWPPAVWLILIALALLVAEELLYHRRKVG